MKLPADFQFSQACLQDFTDCPQRFHLRYVLQLAWPAIENEPMLEHEAQIRVGESFHRLVHCYHLGIPAERLSRMAIEDHDLHPLWENYLIYRPADLAGVHYPETTLSTTLAGHRIVAKYDMLIIEPGRKATIFDWKTSPYRQKETSLLSRLQTVVYRWLLVSAGASLNQGALIEPRQVQMIYWFPHFPESPVRLSYTATKFDQDEELLVSLINRISEMNEPDFYLTEDVQRCAYCAYRSYCGRGTKAQTVVDAEYWVELEDVEDVVLDFEHISEIEF